MRDFQWLADAAMLFHLRSPLTALGVLLALFLAAAAVFVTLELRQNGRD